MTKPIFSIKTAWPWLASLSSGVLLALCYAPFEIAEFIWFWQLPLIAALWFSKSSRPKSRPWRRGLALGYVSGLAFFLTSMTWLLEVSNVVKSPWAGIASWVFLPAYLALYFGAWGAFAHTVGRWIPKEPVELDLDSPNQGPTAKMVAAGADMLGPSLHVIIIAALNGAMWCGLEWLKGVFLTGFPWNGLAIALYENLALIQIADIIGMTGISFALVFCSCAAVATVVRLAREIRERKRVRPHLDFAVAISVVILMFLYGISHLTSEPEETIDLRALLIQLNIPIEDKWSGEEELIKKTIFDYRDLTRAYVESSDYDLVIWPETAIPGRFSYPWVHKYFNEHVLSAGDFNLVTGLETDDFESGAIFNSVVVMKGNTESYQAHNKIHLVPFGEYIPFRNSFPILKPILGKIIPVDFSKGTSYEPLKLGDTGVEIIPLVCFEDTIGDLSRRFIRDRPQIMINVTNDGWFFDSAQSKQHMAHAVFRCIELRRPMARAANTGVSCFIDEKGSLYDRSVGNSFKRIVADDVSGSTYVRGTLPATLKVNAKPPITIYAKVGEAFSIGCFVIGMALCL